MQRKRLQTVAMMRFFCLLFITSVVILSTLFCCNRKQPEENPVISKAVGYIQQKGISSFGMDYIKQKYPFALKYPEKDDFGKNFVTAFVLSALDRNKEPELFEETAALLISKQGKNGLWSFDDHGISTDSDTTLTVLVSLIQANEIGKDRISMAQSAVTSKYIRSCGLASINNSRKHSNFATHLEPTANYLFFLTMTDIQSGVNANCIANEIIRRQYSDGSFNAYWYPSKFFATFLAVRALAAYNRSLAEQTMLSAADFIVKKRNSDGGWGEKSNAFDTAFAIMTLGIIDKTKYENAISSGLKWLKFSQNPDGSWNGSIIFNYYYTQCESRNCPEPWHDIDRKLISTSLAVRALRTFPTIR